MKDVYKFWLAVLLLVVLIFFPVKSGFSMEKPKPMSPLDISMNLPKMDLSFNMFN